MKTHDLVIVNGTVTFEGTECSGALPGKLLRSYDSRLCSAKDPVGHHCAAVWVLTC